MKNINLKSISLIISLFLFSCENNVKFEKSLWNQKDDLSEYENRDSMLKDLTENHKLKGLTYIQLIDLLGPPENYSDDKSNIMTYNILKDYQYRIDPTYIKQLKFELSKDSIVKNFKIIELKH